MRKYSIVTAICLLEILALSLAFLHVRAGLISDEAKYLLSIPYPHPPLLRNILSFTSGIPFHELFWRFIFASFLLQAVWFVWDLGDVLTRPRRLALAASWLLSSAVLLQSGVIVMATFSALSGLIFLWWTLHPTSPRNPAIIASLWLASLFIAYQSILFLPLVFSALRRCHISKLRVALYLGIPLVLLVVYSLTNPYALTLMFHLSGQDMAIPPLTCFFHISWIWIVAGSGLLSLVGTVGILSSVRLDLVAAFGILLGYVVLSSASYYSILFTPLLIGGLFLLFCKRRLSPVAFIVAQALCTAAILIASFPTFQETPARAEIRALSRYDIAGTLLIDGFFGHDWQYESPMPVRRFNQELSIKAEAQAGVFVCTKIGGCDDDINPDTWLKLADTPFPTWIRKNPVEPLGSTISR